MIRFGNAYAELAGIQYIGRAGVSASCLNAIRRLFVAGDRIESGLLLSADKTHAFMLNMGEEDHPEWVAIKAGFSSGYPGEGPRSLSEALALLFSFGIYVNEVKVDRAVLHRLGLSALTLKDLEFIARAPQIKATEVALYIYREHLPSSDKGRAFRQLHSPIPWGVLDYRLFDLARKFEQDPDHALMAGFRRLEDLVRTRIGTDASEAKVFSQAFLGEKPLLTWTGIPNAERLARGNLFTGAYGAFRNPRAHRELPEDHASQICQLHTLNHLFRLEAEAVKTTP